MPETPNFKLREPLPPPTAVASSPFAYAELEVSTNFSFLRGAAHPDELVYQAAELGYRAIGITDRHTLAGIVRAHAAAKGCGLKLLVGSRLVFEDAPDLLVWAPDRRAYGRLCRLLTLGKRRAEKGECKLFLRDFIDHHEGLLAACALSPSPGTQGEGWGEGRRGNDEVGTMNDETEDRFRLSHRSSFALHRSPEDPLPHPLPEYWEREQERTLPECWARELGELRDLLGDRLSLVVSRVYGGDDESHVARLAQLSRYFDIPLLATNGVHYHDPGRRALQDVLTCIRHGCTITEAGFKLFPNAERYLKSPEQMHRLFVGHPHALRRGVDLAERCNFRMDELRYEYPDEIAPAGQSPVEYLAHLTWTGAAARYPGGIPDKVRRQLEHELRLIEQLKFEAYFLTVYDVVKFARSRDILCQGRGSAANSAVCYCLGVTSVDPARIDLLFERFVSAARGEPPDIDIDFEHERREEVIQYLYNKYGRDRCGMSAEVITYRGRSAIRDVGKAMGLSLDMVDSMAKRLDWWHRGQLSIEMIKEAGLDPGDQNVRLIVALAGQLLGFPRHLGQHVGGMVMTRGPLCELVPIENAAMEDRTVIEWDKDDIEELGILKVDALGLGMLTCISKAFRLIGESDGATERRSDEGQKREEATERGSYEGEESDEVAGVIAGGGSDGSEGADLSRPDRVAALDATGASAVRGYRDDAEVGAIRADQPDAAGRGVNPLQHCGGTRAAEPAGLSEAPPDRTRFTRGAFDSGGTGRLAGHDLPTSATELPPPGSGPNPARLDPQPGEEERQLAPSPLPLRRSVAPSLRRYELHTVPAEDPAVYDMICDADTVGVFQIESRAQMSMLPRLRPRNFYDIVIEVAIVRPGPIQGNMVHPYLRRRNGEEGVTYPSEALREVLEKTLGVPLFQEQAMRVAMVGAGFSADEADKLRRAMAAWRKSSALEAFHVKIVDGMLRNGYTREFAEQCFMQIRGFGEYGFPESHSASFALLVYVSAWIKRHHPAAFCAALLNSQPMGFYAPAQLVRDAKEHGVEVRAADVNYSDWDCTLEEREDRGWKMEDGAEATGARATPQRSCGMSGVDPAAAPRRGAGDKSTWGIDGPVVRLGFRQIKRLPQRFAEQIVAARRAVGRFESIESFHKLTRVPVHVVRKLAEADAFGSLGVARRPAFWEAMALSDEQSPLFDETLRDPLHRSVASSLRRSDDVSLPAMPVGQEVMVDYSTTSLSLKRHPLALVRDVLAEQRVITAAELQDTPHGRWVKVAGLVLIRQRPGTASGIVFVTLEDETGVANLIVRPNIFDRYRLAARHAALLQCDGYVERQGQVVHVMAKRLFDRSHLIRGFELSSRDFH